MSAAARRHTRLASLARLGPYFAVAVHEAGTAPDGAWLPLPELLDAPDRRTDRVEAARAALATTAGRGWQDVPRRVAASVVHLGLTARLVSPLLALASLHGLDEVPAVMSLRWQDTPGSTVPLSLPAPLLERRPTAAPDWDRWAGALVGVLAGLSQAFARLCPSPHVRAGNLASAVHGAVTVIGAHPEEAPDATAQRARSLGRLLLSHPLLREAGTGDPGTRWFRRRSCCLIYRAAEPSAGGTPRLCGDCVLGRPDAGDGPP